MGSSSDSSASSVTRRLLSGAKVARSRRIPSSDRAASLQELKAFASRCQTPKQFRELLERLRAVIPYEKFTGTWGYPSRTTIRYIFNEGFPTDLIRWRLTTGALWTSPAFQEWLRLKRAFLWCDAAKRLKAQFDPELLTRMTQAGLQYSLCGGFASPDRFVMFAAAMPSARSGRAHLKLFEFIVPWLAQASSVPTRARSSRSARPPSLSVVPRERLANRLRQRRGSVSARSGNTCSRSKGNFTPMIS